MVLMPQCGRRSTPEPSSPESRSPTASKERPPTAPEGAASSSLDPQESTADLPDDLYRSFRHSGSFTQRQRIWDALLRLHRYSRVVFGLHTREPDSLLHAGVNSNPYSHIRDDQIPGLGSLVGEAAGGRRRRRPPFHHGQLESFRTCGSNAWILRTTDRPHRYKIATNRCKHRFCPACQAERGRLIAARMTDLLPRKRLRFITLTIRTDHQPLAVHLDHLYTSFRRLRQTKAWRKHVSGSLWVVEITWRHERERWHPHLHVVAAGVYWPQNSLRIAWGKATGDSYICDIRPVRSSAHISHYLTKYLTKSLAGSVWHQPDRLCEAIVALHGRKLIGTTGSWAKLKLLSPPEDDLTWKPICPASSLLREALRGDQAASIIATVIWKSGFTNYAKEHPP